MVIRITTSWESSEIEKYEENDMNPDRALAEISDRLARWRRDAGYTLQQLGDRSGVAPSTIHKVETGKTVPTVSVIIKIARGLGRRASDVVANDEPGIIHTEAGEHQASEAGPDVTVHRLGETIETWRILHRPGHVTSELCLSDRGETLLLCERGEVAVQVGRHELLMRTGDTIQLESAERVALASDTLAGAQLLVIGQDSRSFRVPDSIEVRASAEAR